jgi:hypothetical protein
VWAMHFSYTMESQLGGILRAGFVITDCYEEYRKDQFSPA